MVDVATLSTLCCLQKSQLSRYSCCRKRYQVRQNGKPWIMKKIHRMIWCRETADPEKGTLEVSKVTSAPTDGSSESSPLSDGEN